MAKMKQPKVKKEKVQSKVEPSPLPLPVASPLPGASSKKSKKKKVEIAELDIVVPELLVAPDSPASSPEKDKNGEDDEWPKDDDMELFSRIQNNLPKDDVMKYESRVHHLDWEAICFKEYSPEDCKKRWLFVQGRIRRFKTIKELIDDAIEWRSRPWSNFNKGSKSQKHPDYPKKPLTSYMLFYMEKKDEILENQPGLGMTELSKIIAKMYNEMSDRKKEKYSEQAKVQKEQYELKVRKFMDEHPDYIPLKNEKVQHKYLPPKAPTPFRLYTDVKMPKLTAEGLTPAEAKDKCKENYKALSDKKRLKWIYKAVEQEEVYIAEYEKFKVDHPGVDMGARKSVLNKDETQLKKKMEGKPDKPPNSGYSLYSRELLASQQFKHLETKDRMTEISTQWKSLNDEERQKYNDRTQELVHAYKLEYASYLESLLPEQREEELRSTQRTKKRPAAGATSEPKKKRAKAQPEAIKSKEVVAASTGDSSDENDEDDDSDDEPKSAIQKPISSLQLFCDQNLAKYKKKNPKMTQQELKRLMAKEFSSLPEKKKKVYATMAEKAKAEINKPSPKPKAVAKPKAAPASPSKITPAKISSPSVTKETSKPAPIGKVSKVTTEAPTKSSQKPASKATAKLTPERTKNSDSSPAKASALTPKQVLYKNEPPKPPESTAAFYGITVLKDPKLSKDEVEERWEKLSDKQKKKYVTLHNKKKAEYVTEFETFVRNLQTDELKSFRAFMKKRDNPLDSDDDNDEEIEEVEEDEEDGEQSEEESSSEESSDTD